MGDWAGTQADGSVSGAATYKSGGQEFESLRARQHLAPTFRAKNTVILRNLQGTKLAPILRLMRSCIGQWLAPLVRWKQGLLGRTEKSDDGRIFEIIDEAIQRFGQVT
jgi:hypothetical protein